MPEPTPAYTANQTRAISGAGNNCRNCDLRYPGLTYILAIQLTLKMACQALQGGQTITSFDNRNDLGKDLIRYTSPGGPSSGGIVFVSNEDTFCDKPMQMCLGWTWLDSMDRRDFLKTSSTSCCHRVPWCTGAFLETSRARPRQPTHQSWLVLFPRKGAGA